MVAYVKNSARLETWARDTGKDVYTAMCVVKRFHGRSACLGIPSGSTTSRRTGKCNSLLVLYRHLAARHCTQFALYLGLAICLPRQLRAGLHREHVVSSPPTALPPPLCRSESSRWIRALLDSGVNGDRQFSVAAFQVLC